MTSINFQKISKVRTNFALLLLLVLNTMTAFAQNKTTPNMEELKLKSKHELIQIAFTILKEKQPSLVINPDDFESTAWGNSKEIIVKFRRYIRFIPLNAEQDQYHYISINLINKQIFPFDSIFNFTLYIPSKEDKEKLDFIKSKTDFPEQATSEITIIENENYYWISNSSKTSLSKFFINKETGFKSGLLEGRYSAPQVKPVLEPTYDYEEKIKLFEVDELSKKAKKEIIDMAVTLVNKRNSLLKLDFNDYESTILGNSRNTFVEFKRVIRYVPLGTEPEKHFSYDITVNLNTTQIFPFDDFFESDFYIETDKDKKSIEFVKKNFGGFTSDFENTIYEGEDDYYIDQNNQYSFGKYIVNKKTGIAKTEIQGSWDPPPKPNVIEDLDILVEIKK